MRGSYTGYSPDQTPTLSRPYFNGKVDGRIDVTRDTRIDLATSLLVSTDNPEQPEPASRPLQASGLRHLRRQRRHRRSNSTASNCRIKGDVERTVYQDRKLTDGSTASNDDRQYDQYTGPLRGGYELIAGRDALCRIDADTACTISTPTLPDFSATPTA